ncbi:MAG TPA: DMT family transporter [Acidobacteriaceae bacterium]|nr:DMT family transporter [Acidobacteriaceae bacterium]
MIAVAGSLAGILPANALLALASATAWGGGDFSGGMGVKAAGGSTAGALRVVLVAHASSLAVLLGIVWLQHAPVPHGAPLAWGIVAGVTAGISLTAFYIALARGAMGASAALSGLLAAAIPAAVSSVLEGVPGTLRLLGFALALAAIWLIAAGPSPEAGHSVDGSVSPTARSDARANLVLALIGGIGFGIYFVALRLANPLGEFEPMALARAASLVTCALLLLFVTLRKTTHRGAPSAKGSSSGRGGFWLPRAAIGWALGVALLDTGGNLLFIASTRVGRLDVAAVLASLYPAGTILLAAWRLHERPTRRQLTGMAIALGAVVLITV